MLRSRPASRPPAPPVPGGLGSALGLVAATCATLLAAAVGARAHPLLGLALLAGAVLPVAATATGPAALAAAAQTWALWDGFLVNRFGELTFTTASVGALVLLGLAALVAAGTGRRWRCRADVPAPPRRPPVRGHDVVRTAALPS